jgi:DNA invertase Pin-like site-specific DNA recombinase
MTSKFPSKKSDIIHLIDEEVANNRPDIVWAVYSRKSRVKPNDPGYSMEYQPDVVEKYAREHGAKEVLFFEDVDKSGKNSKRDGFQDMLYAVKSGRVDVVAVHRIDRIFRNHRSTLELIDLLKKYKVKFVSVTENIDTDNWWGRLVLAVLSSLAEAYVLQTSDRNREIFEAVRAKGKQLGRHPLGYCNGLCSTCTDFNGDGYCPLYGGFDRPESKRGTLMVPHPIDRHVIVLIYDIYKQGMSFRDIANYLNNSLMPLPDGSQVKYRPRGLYGKKRKEGEQKFNRESIRIILSNPDYAGYVPEKRRPPLSMEDDLEHPENIPNPKIEGNAREILALYPAQHDPLISYATWLEIQSLKKTRAGSPAKKKGTPARKYPLSGVVRCWECYETLEKEFTLRGSTGGRGHIYYRCAYVQDFAPSRRKKRKTPRIDGVNPIVDTVDRDLIARHKQIPAGKLEEQVDRLVSRLMVPLEWGDMIAAYFLADDGMADFDRAGYTFRQELQKLKDLHEAGHISGPELERKTRLLQNSLKELMPTSKPEGQEILKELRPFGGFWRKLQDGDKHILLSIIFDSLFFNSEGKLIRAVAHEPFDQMLDLPSDGLLADE